MIDKNSIPAHWEVKRIGDVGKVKGGKRLPKGAQYSEEKTPFLYLRVTDFENQTINQEKLKCLTSEIQQLIKNYTISKDDVFISIAGTIGVTGIIPTNLDGANLTENAAKITELKSVNKKYLSFFLSSHNGQLQITKSTKTTTQPKLSLYRIEEIALPIPPLPEQNEIVAKIEELLSELDQGKQQLEAARQQLKVYRQAVLKWAFEGKLTNAEVKEGELPEDWKWVKFKELFSGSPQNGIYKSSTEYGSGTKIIRIDGFYAGKILDDYEYKKIRLSQDEIYKYKVSLSDILVNRVNSMSHLGKCGLVRHLNEETVFESNIMRIRVKIDDALPEYVSIYLSSKKGITELTKNAKHAVNQASINQTDVGNAIIPLPTLEEQKQIVQEIESRLSICDKLEETIAQSLQQAETLRQSILKQAFEGKLLKNVEAV